MLHSTNVIPVTTEDFKSNMIFFWIMDTKFIVILNFLQQVQAFHLETIGLGEPEQEKSQNKREEIICLV
jgi:hypothetical protein